MAGGHGDSGTGIKFFDYPLFFIKLIFDLKKQVDYVGNWGISRALYLTSLFIGLYVILGHLIPNLPTFTFRWMVGTAPLWMPVALWLIAWNAWVWYIQALFLSGRNPVLLELKVHWRAVTLERKVGEISRVLDANMWALYTTPLTERIAADALRDTEPS